MRRIAVSQKISLMLPKSPEISRHFMFPRIAPSTRPNAGFLAVTRIRVGVLGWEENGVIRSECSTGMAGDENCDEAVSQSTDELMFLTAYGSTIASLIRTRIIIIADIGQQGLIKTSHGWRHRSK